MNILVGCVYNIQEEKLINWVKSSKNLSYDRIVLLLMNCDGFDLSVLDEFNVEIKNYNYIIWSEDNISRHRCYMDFMNSLEDSDIVLITDVYDVYFQDDAFEWWNKNIGNNKLLFTSEGLKFKDEEWNLSSIRHNFPEQSERLLDSEIINGGIIMGYKRWIYDLSYFIYLVGMKREFNTNYGKDQPVLNTCLNAKIFRDVSYISNPNECFGINCANIGPSYNGIKYKSFYIYDEPIFENGEVQNYKREKYCIVHQYNRIPEFEKLLGK